MSTGFMRAAREEFPVGSCILEVGSERGEGSTEFLAILAKERSLPFYTVDPDPEANARAREYPAAIVVPRKGEDFLRSAVREYLLDRNHPAFVFEPLEPIHFAYLDGFDWPYSWLVQDGRIVDWIEHYRHRLGMRLTKVASQVSHLIQAVYLDFLMNRAGSIIVIDDTWRHLSDGPAGTWVETWTGKGGMAVPFLTETLGWEVFESQTGVEPDGAWVGLRRPEPQPVTGETMAQVELVSS